MRLIVALVCSIGIASQYSPGVMQQVVRNRQAIGQLQNVSGIDGFAAVSDCARIGDRITIDDRPFMISDCAGDDATRLWMRNVLVEVDYETALRYQAVGRGFTVKVCEQSVRRTYTPE